MPRWPRANLHGLLHVVPLEAGTLLEERETRRAGQNRADGRRKLGLADLWGWASCTLVIL